MPHRPTEPVRRAPSLRELARLAGLLCAGIACGSAQAQGDSAGLQRMVAADAGQLLTHADPAVRGEAALVVAAQRNPQNEAAVIAVARDSDPAAQLRGLLALGLQSTAGVVPVLDEFLSDPSERVRAPGVAAAFALGSLPPDQAPMVTTRVLTSFLHASWKRQREVLLALLLGLATHEQSAQRAALCRLYDEESNRDPEVRARLLRLLLPIDQALDAERLRKVFERGSDEERTALLGWLGGNASPLDDELLPLVERIAAHGDRPQLRASALAMLTRLRHLPALEIAAKALRSNHPVEAAEGMRSALAIGGAGLRRALEAHVCDETDPVRKEALLSAFSTAPSRNLADHCSRLAADRTQPLSLRTAAATTLARTDALRAAPLLRDLFRDTEDAELSARLATAMLAGDGDKPALARLLQGPADLRQQPERWQPLLAASHPEATRQLLDLLRHRDARATDLQPALRAWRRGAVFDLQAADAALLPPALRSLFVD